MEFPIDTCSRGGTGSESTLVIPNREAARLCETPLLPSHARLLLSCLGVTLGSAEASAIARVLSEGTIDWPAFARTSIRQGVAQIVGEALEAFSDDPRVPGEITTCFRRMQRANAKRNAVMFRECARLLRGLDAAGVPCLLLKGVGLALSVYPDPALRNFADIDLLVEPADLDTASRVACALGFTPAYEEADTHLLHRSFTAACAEDILLDTLPLEFESDPPLDKIERNRHRLVVEVHQGLFRDASGMLRRQDIHALWQSPRGVCFPDGTSATIPAPEAQLIHLASHAAGHGFSRLLFFVDIAEVVRCYGTALDWERVLTLAHRYHVTGPLYRCLELAHREFGVALPVYVLPELRRTRGLFAAPAPLRWENIFGAEREFGPALTLQSLRQSQSLSQFCVALWHILLPPPVLMRRYYKVKRWEMVALLYLARPFLLTAHMVQVAFRHLLSGR